MIQLFGEGSLYIALGFALLQSLATFWGYWRNNPFAIACARPAAWGQFICVLSAYCLLTFAFITNDFSIAYVAANSHETLPFMYRATAVWGAHEGSILLWVLILALWTFIFSLQVKDNRQDFFKPLVLAILGLISVFFLIFLLFTSNPFQAASLGQTAQDLNPLLQDPGFIIHPPMLYMGYVGFSTAFAITVAALLQGMLDRRWIYTAKLYAIAAWCFLTFGIMLGSWWAYRVLGWGGFWFWDPVENASLLPWLAGTALIHILILVEKRGSAKAWAALLAIICFSLSLLGTFLVRSGVLISAHTFASDPSRGVFLLLLLAILLLSALTIYLLRLPAASQHVLFPALSRETSLIVNSALLMIAMATILLGTLYPLIVDALHLGSISVGAPYFNIVMLPLLFILMAAMGAGALCRWQGQTLREWWLTARKNGAISLLLAALLVYIFTAQFLFVTVTSLALSFWVILSVLPQCRLQPAMSLAHAGFAILIIGIVLSSTLNQEKEVRMRPGNAVRVGPYQFFFIDTQGINGSNYRGIQAEFEVLKDTRHVTSLYPEKRIYTVRDMVMTKVDIHPGIFRDLYIALGEPLAGDDWSVRIYYKPFIRWIWLGGILMMISGVIAIFTRRKPL